MHDDYAAPKRFAGMKRKVSLFLGAARNVWPLSSAMEARSMRTLAVDSFESSGAGRPLEEGAR